MTVHTPMKQCHVLQTRLTALDLIGFAAGDERPRQFVHMPEAELEQELMSIKVCPDHFQCITKASAALKLSNTRVVQEQQRHCSSGDGTVGLELGFQVQGQG